MRHVVCAICQLSFLTNNPRQYLCGSKYNRKGCSYKNQYMGIRYQKLIKHNFTCENCGLHNRTNGFLDLDHIDGNKHNDNPSNHQLLCPNCHRLKTLACKDNYKNNPTVKRQAA